MRGHGSIAAAAMDGTDMKHERREDVYIRPRYPVDDPPTFRAKCSCGWTGPERYATTGLDWNDHYAINDLWKMP